MSSAEKVPMVSVLVTSYNRAGYIEETIESILKQTYHDYEIVISDNCSSDNTMQVLEKYRSNPKISIHQNETNIGQFPNRNKCAELAKGKYLKYLDSDDLMYPWGLELLVQMMEQFPEAGWGLCSLTQIIEKPYPIVLTPRQAFLHQYNTVGIFDKAPLSAIIKKKAFEAVNGFEDISMAGDFDMWQKLALSFPVVLMPDGIVWNRVHEGQEMRNFRKFILQYETVRVKYLWHALCPLSQKEVAELIRKRRKENLRFFLSSLLKLKFRAAKNYLNIFFFYLNK